jgi:hypothetical protein
MKRVKTTLKMLTALFLALLFLPVSAQAETIPESILTQAKELAEGYKQGFILTKNFIAEGEYTQPSLLTVTLQPSHYPW